VAITWLEALGFETTTRQQDDGGATVHAEIRLGDAVVMVAPADEPYEMPKLIGRSTGHGLYLLADDGRTATVMPIRPPRVKPRPSATAKTRSTVSSPRVSRQTAVRRRGPPHSTATTSLAQAASLRSNPPVLASRWGVNAPSRDVWFELAAKQSFRLHVAALWLQLLSEPR
jgi:hypothetical protein